MKRFSITVVAFLLQSSLLPLTAVPVRAASLFTCAAADRGQYEAVCADRELLALGRVVSAQFKSLLAASDPLIQASSFQKRRGKGEVSLC